MGPVHNQMLPPVTLYPVVVMTRPRSIRDASEWLWREESGRQRNTSHDSRIQTQGRRCPLVVVPGLWWWVSCWQLAPPEPPGTLLTGCLSFASLWSPLTHIYLSLIVGAISRFYFCLSWLQFWFLLFKLRTFASTTHFWVQDPEPTESEWNNSWTLTR